MGVLKNFRGDGPDAWFTTGLLVVRLLKKVCVVFLRTFVWGFLRTFVVFLRTFGVGVLKNFCGGS